MKLRFRILVVDNRMSSSKDELKFKKRKNFNHPVGLEPKIIYSSSSLKIFFQFSILYKFREYLTKKKNHDSKDIFNK